LNVGPLLPSRLGALDRWRGGRASLAGGLVTVVALLFRWQLQEALTLAILAAMTSDLAVVSRLLVDLSPEDSRQFFGGLQPNRSRLLRRTILMAFIAVLVLGFCVHDTLARAGPLPARLRIALFFAAIFSTWLELHLAFAFYYVKAYYAGNKTGQEAGEDAQVFIFPGNDNPAFSDFLYVAYSVALTFAMSDVDAEDSKVRRVVLLQALVSFLFYTIIFSVVTNLMVS